MLHRPRIARYSVNLFCLRMYVSRIATLTHFQSSILSHRALVKPKFRVKEVSSAFGIVTLEKQHDQLSGNTLSIVALNPPQRDHHRFYNIRRKYVRPTMLRMSTTWNSIAILIVALLTVVDATGDHCIPRNLTYGTVCVCNSTYCDFVAVNVPAKGEYRIYESGSNGKRLSQRTGRIDNGTSDDNDVNTITLTLSPNQKYQKIHGFGGAFTDSTGINMKKLSQGAQDLILQSYFSPNGSAYSIGRVPIGGTDFSERPYTYDDFDGDVGLQRFELPKEDREYKIPFMQKALKINPNLKFLSAAWTAPPWMKSNDEYGGPGFLKDEYYQTYADYLMKFLTTYKENGLKIWAITTGNEPTDTLVPMLVKFETMGWSPATMSKWVANNFGPTIAKSELNDTIILMLDDQRFDLPWYVVDVFDNPVAKDYIAGIAVHWYFDTLFPTRLIDLTHDQYPDKFLIITEACIGSGLFDHPKVRLGDWNRGQRYVLNIMENLNHWMTGWVDWNLALDNTGGPNWVQNFVDSPIIVNPETDEFFKQPMYYALAHFSKFVKPGSTRIGMTDHHHVKTIAFTTPDNDNVIVLCNRSGRPQTVRIVDREQGVLSAHMSPYSIQTLIYKR